MPQPISSAVSNRVRPTSSNPKRAAAAAATSRRHSWTKQNSSSNKTEQRHVLEDVQVRNQPLQIDFKDIFQLFFFTFFQVTSLSEGDAEDELEDEEESELAYHDEGEDGDRTPGTNRSSHHHTVGDTDSGYDRSVVTMSRGSNSNNAGSGSNVAAKDPKLWSSFKKHVRR